MPWLCPDEGEKVVLDTFLDDAGVGNWHIDLFVNNVTPVAGTVFADLTLLGEAQDVDADDWPASTTNGDGKAESVNTETYSWGGTPGYTPISAYGWVIYRGTTILMIERFAGAPQAANDSVAIDQSNIKARLYNP